MTQEVRKPTISRLLCDAGLTDVTAAETFQVHITNVRRWLRGQSCPPESTIMLLKIMAYGLGHLPGAGSAWNGWTFRRGILYERGAINDSHAHTQGSILSWHWLAQQLHELRVREHKLLELVAQSDNVTAISTNLPSADELTQELYGRLRKAAEANG